MSHESCHKFWLGAASKFNQSGLKLAYCQVFLSILMCDWWFCVYLTSGSMNCFSDLRRSYLLKNVVPLVFFGVSCSSSSILNPLGSTPSWKHYTWLLFLAVSCSSKKKKKMTLTQPWILKWGALFLARSWIETTSHLGSTRCTNTLSDKAIRATSKEHT